MKKRLLSIFLAALMLLTLLPVTALAIEDYNVWVCGEQVTSANQDDILGDGAASYTPAAKNSPAKLTLNNASWTNLASDTLLIGAYEELELELVGTNTLTQNDESAAISTWGLTITGNGSLTVNGRIYTNGGLTIADSTNVTVNVDAIWLEGAISAQSITIGDNADVTVNNTNKNDERYHGTLYAWGGDVTITTGGTVRVDAAFGDGIYSQSGAICGQNVTIGGSGTVNVCTDGQAVCTYGKEDNNGRYVGGGDLTIGGSADVTLKSDGFDTTYILGDATINGSGKVTVDARGTEENGHRAIYAKNVAIGGSGTVELYADRGSAVYAYGSVESETRKYLGGGDITISGSVDVTADNNGGGEAIYAEGTVTITTGGTVISDAKDEEETWWSGAIYAKKVAIGGKGEIFAYGGIYADDNISISGDADVTVVGDGNALRVWDGDITITTSGTVNAQNLEDWSAISAAEGSVTIGGSGDVFAYGGIYAEKDITVSTTGTLQAESNIDAALSCSGILHVTGSVGKILLRGNQNDDLFSGAVFLFSDPSKSLDLAKGLAFYGDVDWDTEEKDITAKTTCTNSFGDGITSNAYRLFVGDVAAKAVVLRGNPAARVLQILSDTVATINQVRKVTRTAVMVAVPTIIIVNRLLSRLFR